VLCLFLNLNKDIQPLEFILKQSLLTSHSTYNFTEIFRETGTDKGPMWHGYDYYYNVIFERFRENQVSMMEIGVRGRHSMNAWMMYFNNYEQLVGIDYGIEMGIKSVVEDMNTNVHLVHGDQSNITFWSTFLASSWMMVAMCLSTKLSHFFHYSCIQSNTVGYTPWRISRRLIGMFPNSSMAMMFIIQESIRPSPAMLCGFSNNLL